MLIDPTDALLMENMKVNLAAQLCGLLALGSQWASAEERALWNAALAYMKQQGDTKALPSEAKRFFPEGSA